MKRLFSVFLALFALIVFYSCGPKEEVTYSGSSTIGMNILPEASKFFSQKTGIPFKTIKNPGSGKGLEEMLSGKVLIAGASRKLKKEETDKGAKGVIIGYDAIAVFVHKSNPVSNLSKEQLKGIFTGQIKNWKEVGGNDAPIKPNTEIQGEKRATMEVFEEIIMDKAPYGKGFLEIDYPRDQVPALEKEPNGICAPSLSFITPNVKAVKVMGIEPTTETITNGSYILSRPLLLATKGEAKGSAKALIDYMLSPDGQKFVTRQFLGVK